MRETEQLLPSQDAALLMGGEACEENSPALGSDPFSEQDELDPFVEGLRALGAESIPRPRMRGRALQVDPSTIRSQNLDDIRPGGLGVYIIREIMDEVRYEQRDGGGMRLSMVKQLPATTDSPGHASTSASEGETRHEQR